MEIPFIDLRTQYEKIQKKVKENINRVLSHGRFILGPEVEKLEHKLAEYTNTDHCISCSSGTDALFMSLMAMGIKKKNVVFTTPFTFVATAEVISLLGSVPVFVDIEEDTFNISYKKLERAILAVIKKDDSIYPIPDIIKNDSEDYIPRGIIAVDIFGLCARYNEINEIAKKYDLFVIEDGAQSFGGMYFEKKACSLADIGCTSFFPAKPLGGYGDGGAIFVNSDDYASLLRSIRVHGQGRDKYENIRLGINGRLDTIQAAVLLAKVDIFDEEIEKRQQVAKRYSTLLQDIPHIKFQNIPEGMVSAWAQYCIVVDKRDDLAKFLSQFNIPTAIYYKTPLHLQKAFNYLGYKKGDMGISEHISEHIIALPMHPYLREEVQDFIIEKIKNFYENL